jgi:hypothetical protein
MNNTAIPTWTIVTVTIPKFGSNGLIDYLEFLAHTKLQSKTDVGYRNDKYEIVFNCGGMTKQFLASLALMFRGEAIKWETKEIPRFASKIEYLDYLLKNFDLSYTMSDDHRYWVSGELTKDKVKALIGELVGENKHRGVKALVDLYVPKADGWLDWVESCYNDCMSVQVIGKKVS